MKVAVIGSGYVGLSTAVCLAESGHTVVGVDVDADKVEKLNRGQSPIFEENVDLYLKQNVNRKHLTFTNSLVQALKTGDLIILALPTPPKQDGSADLSYIFDTADQIGKLINSYKVIINKSTAPVGTIAKIKAIISQNTSVDFDVVSNPEFLREGQAISDFMNPDRIIVGTESKKAIEWLYKLYEPFIENENQFIVMDEISAELTKYAANSFLAMKISYMNELANLCERVGANIDCIKSGLVSDSRISHKFLNPGIGFGGSCFPKDIKALIQIAKDHDYDFKIMSAVNQINRRQRTALIQKIKHHFKKELKGKHFALWGLSFKPQTDDIRESAALYHIEQLIESGATLTVYDPIAMHRVEAVWKNKISYAKDEIQALKGADALIICTEWSVFANKSLLEIKQSLKSPVVFDGRNIFNPQQAKKHNMTYYSIGR